MTHRPPKSVDDVTSTTFGDCGWQLGLIGSVIRAWVLLLLLRLTGLEGGRRRRY
jgi:hypothetical protein